MEFIYSGLSFIFGIIIGSFLNVVIWRLPRQQSLKGRSCCPFCGHTLAAPDLVPLLSYLFLKGKCRHCGKPISPRYFLVELLTGLLFLFTWLILAPSAPFAFAQAARVLFVVAVFIAIFAIDLEHYLILDRIVFPAAAAVAVFNLVLDVLSGRALWQPAAYTAGGFLGALALFLPFFFLWYFSQGRWLGFGDVKLALLMGLSLGWPGTAVGFFTAIFSGAIISLVLIFFKGKHLGSRVPFGTFLAFGTVLALWFAPRVMDWYLGLLGF